MLYNVLSRMQWQKGLSKIVDTKKYILKKGRDKTCNCTSPIKWQQIIGISIQTFNFDLGQKEVVFSLTTHINFKILFVS